MLGKRAREVLTYVVPQMSHVFFSFSYADGIAVQLQETIVGLVLIVLYGEW